MLPRPVGARTIHIVAEREAVDTPLTRAGIRAELLTSADGQARVMILSLKMVRQDNHQASILPRAAFLRIDRHLSAEVMLSRGECNVPFCDTSAYINPAL